MKFRFESLIVVALAVTLWFASHSSSAKCLGQEPTEFTLKLVDAGGETSWPSTARLELTYGIVLLDGGETTAGEEGKVYGGSY